MWRPIIWAHPDLEPPFLCLIVSGGHSHIVRVEDYTCYTVLGRTRDDAAGECYDKAARAMGDALSRAGPADRLAPEGNPDAFALPHPRWRAAPMISAFRSETAVVNLLHKAQQKGEEVNRPIWPPPFRKQRWRCSAATCCGRRRIPARKPWCWPGAFPPIPGFGRVWRRNVLAVACGCLCRLFPCAGQCRHGGGTRPFHEYCAGHTAGMELNACPTMPVEAPPGDGGIAGDAFNASSVEKGQPHPIHIIGGHPLCAPDSFPSTRGAPILA